MERLIFWGILAELHEHLIAKLTAGFTLLFFSRWRWQKCLDHSAYSESVSAVNVKARSYRNLHVVLLHVHILNRSASADTEVV